MKQFYGMGILALFASIDSGEVEVKMIERPRCHGRPIPLPPYLREELAEASRGQPSKGPPPRRKFPVRR